VVGRRRRGARRRSRLEEQESLPEEHDTYGDDVERPGRAPAGHPAGAGPYDESDAPHDGVQRVDLGGLLVPVPQGAEVRVDLSDDQVVAANVVYSDSALQLQAFAAPRSQGIWAEVRAELATGISQAGGTVDEATGPYGVELRANVPVRRPDGVTAHEPARFLGYDGSRWFLRGVITGAAVCDPARAGVLENAFGNTVVVRGDTPKPPREPLEMQLPREATPAEAELTTEDADREPIQPFRRGPEITETR
jgi:hypothetical protein